MHPGSQPPSPDLFLGLAVRGNISRRGTLRSLNSEGGEEEEEVVVVGGGEFALDSGADGDRIGMAGGEVKEDVPQRPRLVVKHSFKAGRGLYEQSIEHTT